MNNANPAELENPVDANVSTVKIISVNEVQLADDMTLTLKDPITSMNGNLDQLLLNSVGAINLTD